jgi:hypothetical protein
MGPWRNTVTSVIPSIPQMRPAHRTPCRIAYVGSINSVRIDPFTGDLVIAPEKPGDKVADLRLKDGMQRYSHLFSFSDAAE